MLKYLIKYQEPLKQDEHTWIPILRTYKRFIY